MTEWIFSKFTLELSGRFTIMLTKFAACHALFPGTITKESRSQSSLPPVPIFTIQHSTTEGRKLTGAEVLKIHQQLGPCSEKQLAELLKFGHCVSDSPQIQRINHRCNCQRSVPESLHRRCPAGSLDAVERYRQLISFIPSQISGQMDYSRSIESPPSITYYW